MSKEKAKGQCIDCIFRESADYSIGADESCMSESNLTEDGELFDIAIDYLIGDVVCPHKVRKAVSNE